MTTKYYDYDWDKLPAEAQKAAEFLGYDKKMWDKDKEPAVCEKYWEKLTPGEKNAAALLGYTQETWDESDESSSSSEE